MAEVPHLGGDVRVRVRGVRVRVRVRARVTSAEMCAR